jgi:TnpA family transposase
VFGPFLKEFNELNNFSKADLGKNVICLKYFGSKYEKSVGNSFSSLKQYSILFITLSIVVLNTLILNVSTGSTIISAGLLIRWSRRPP